jgi:hypothetical protein
VGLLAIVILVGVSMVGTRLSGMFRGTATMLSGSSQQGTAGDFVVAAGGSRTIAGLELQAMLGLNPSWSRFWVRDVTATASSGIVTRPTMTSISYTAPSTPGTYAITLSYSSASGPPVGGVLQPPIVGTRTVMMQVR